jgi:hypothetical protein
VWDGLRTMLPQDVPPGGEVEVPFEIEAPRQPGTWVLELDAVREQIAWFSDRRPGSTVRRTVEVAPPAR